MNKQILLVCLLTSGALGCFGSNSEENSQCLPGPCPWQGGSGTGTAGTGTSTGTGGTGGSGSNPNGPIVGSPLATFDTATGGFILDDYMDSNPAAYTNIANKGEWADKGKTAPTITFNMDDGSPSAGSLQVVAPFDGKNQHFDVQSPSLAPIQNWSGGTLHVRIRVAQGSLSAGAGAQLFIKTTATYIYGGTYVNFPTAGQGNWKDFAMPLDNPMTQNSGYDASMAISYGVQINTGSSVTSQGPATFEFDSFSVSGIATGSGGTGGAGGTTGAGGSGDASVGN